MPKKLSRTAQYYRDNPEARKKKAATDKKINARPEQLKKRRELAKKRYHDKKAGKDISGKDFDHASGRYTSPSKNRGKGNSGTPGDRKARGAKKQVEKGKVQNKKNKKYDVLPKI